MIEMFCKQRVVTIAQPCEYTKNHWIIHCKWWILWYINYLNTTVIFLMRSWIIPSLSTYEDVKIKLRLSIGMHVLNLKAVFIIHFPSLVSTTFTNLYWSMSFMCDIFSCLFTFPSLTTWVNAEPPSSTMVRTWQQGFWPQSFQWPSMGV